ncbi:MAG: MFS transporter [Bacteroidales bacterium]|nr:MFS transporter [Bacteroidales bacterium]
MKTKPYKVTKVFIAACIGMSLFGISMMVMGALLPLLSAKFSLNTVQATTLVAFLPVGMLIGSTIFGPIVDRYGYKALLIVSSALVLLGLEGMMLFEDILLVQLSIMGIGLGGGILNGETNAMVSDIYDETKRESKLSFLGIFYGIGALGIPLLLSNLGNIYTYSQIIRSLEVFFVIGIIYCIVITYPLPKHQQGFPIRKSFKLLRNKQLLFLSFILFFQSGIEGSTNNWTVLYLVNNAFTSQETALLSITVMILALTMARIILVWLLKKIDPNKILIFSILLAIVGYLLLIKPTYTTTLIGMACIGMGLASTFPIVLGKIGSLYSSLSGTAFSIALVIALIGNNILNSMTGVFTGTIAPVLYPLLMIVSLIAILLLNRKTFKIKH